MNVHISADNISLKTDIEGKIELVLSVTKDTAYAIKNAHSEFKQGLCAGKQLSVELKWKTKKRSLDANAYAWKLMSLIADAIHSTKDEVYLQMLKRYGVFTHVILKTAIADRVCKDEFRLYEVLGEVTVNGQTGTQVCVYIGSSSYTTSEMSKLIDGIVSECKELEIETLTGKDIDLLKREWGK
jgi:hypothetical protein